MIRRQPRSSAAKKKNDKNMKKKKHNKEKCVRVQSHIGRVSELSCENHTHTAIAHRRLVMYRETLMGMVRA